MSMPGGSEKVWVSVAIAARVTKTRILIAIPIISTLLIPIPRGIE